MLDKTAAFCIAAEKLLIRADALQKRGNSLRLLEIKAKSRDRGAYRLLRNRGGGIDSEWQECVLDVEFQQYDIERCHADDSIEPFLLLANKAVVSPFSRLHQRFLAKHVLHEPTNRGRLTCIDRGLPDTAPILVKVPAADASGLRRRQWRDEEGRTSDEAAQELARICNDGRKPAVALGSKCNPCAFRVKKEAVGGGQKSGLPRY